MVMATRCSAANADDTEESGEDQPDHNSPALPSSARWMATADRRVGFQAISRL